MRKSSLILLLAVAFVLATAAASFSAGDSIVECSSWDYGLEISTATPADSCPYFDYELGSAQSDCRGGYCPGQAVEGVIMRLCACDAITDLSQSELDELNANGGFWFRFTLTSPATGVYWTNENFDDEGSPISQNVEFAVYPDVPATYCANSGEATQISYSAVAPASQSLWEYDCGADDCCFTCGNNKVTQIKTAASEFIVQADHPVVVINLPTLVWDPSIINAGDKVTVHIELMGDCGVVCTEGKVFCEGDVELGTFTDCKEYPCNVCLPYLVGSGYGEGSWTGIALTNSSSAASTSIVKVHDGDVTISETFTVPAHSVKAVLLSDFTDFEDLPAGSRSYATVQSEVPTTAFVMLSLNGNLQGYYGLVNVWGKVSTCEEADICAICGPPAAANTCGP